MGESSTGIIAPAITCAEPECPEPGQWRPVIHVFDDRGHKIPGEVVLPNLLICAGHKEEAARDIVESCWDEIISAFAGWSRGKIVKDKTKIFYEPV